MLYFCSVLEIKQVMASASRYDDEYDRMRKTVTEDMNAYMRRTLDWETGVEEIFDTHNVEFGGSFSVWLGKKEIDKASVNVYYSQRRVWDADNVIPFDDVMVDSRRGKLIIYAMTRPGKGTVRVGYSGGYRAVGATDVMDCPSKLKDAALAECVYRLTKLLNNNVNNSSDNEGRTQSPQRKLVGGLLSDTAAALQEYRKPLGGLA